MQTDLLATGYLIEGVVDIKETVMQFLEKQGLFTVYSVSCVLFGKPITAIQFP